MICWQNIQRRIVLDSKKKSKQKPRREVVYATTSCMAGEIKLSYNPITDSVDFITPVKNTYNEVSYERVKNAKVLNRTPLRPTKLKFNADCALEDFDLIVAVDTNSRIIGGRNLSVAGIVLGYWATDIRTQSRMISYQVPFCIEFVDLIEPRERIGWTMAVTELVSRRYFSYGTKIALIVDAYLDEIPSMNAREIPIQKNFFLPEGVTLLYASSDVGAEYGANKMIQQADRISKQVLDYMSNGRSGPNNKVMSGYPFKGYRIIFGKESNSG